MLGATVLCPHCNKQITTPTREQLHPVVGEQPAPQNAGPEISTLAPPQERTNPAMPPPSSTNASLPPTLPPKTSTHDVRSDARSGASDSPPIAPPKTAPATKRTPPQTNAGLHEPAAPPVESMPRPIEASAPPVVLSPRADGANAPNDSVNPDLSGPPPTIPPVDAAEKDRRASDRRASDRPSEANESSPDESKSSSPKRRRKKKRRSEPTSDLNPDGIKVHRDAAKQKKRSTQEEGRSKQDSVKSDALPPQVDSAQVSAVIESRNADVSDATSTQAPPTTTDDSLLPPSVEAAPTGAHDSALVPAHDAVANELLPPGAQPAAGNANAQLEQVAVPEQVADPSLPKPADEVLIPDGEGGFVTASSRVVFMEQGDEKVQLQKLDRKKKNEMLSIGSTITYGVCILTLILAIVVLRFLFG